MAIKRSLGALEQLDRPAADWFDHFVPTSGFRKLPIAAIATLDSHFAQYDVDVNW